MIASLQFSSKLPVATFATGQNWPNRACGELAVMLVNYNGLMLFNLAHSLSSKESPSSCYKLCGVRTNAIPLTTKRERRARSGWSVLLESSVEFEEAKSLHEFLTQRRRWKATLRPYRGPFV